MREYRRENTEKINKTKREYNTKNNERIKKHRNERITCGCGVISSRAKMYLHKRTDSHKQWEMLYEFIYS